MGKNLWHAQSLSNPGCMWGVLHVLKYQHWRHVTRRLPHRLGVVKTAKSNGSGNQGSLASSSNANKTPLSNHVEGDSSVDDKMRQSTPATKGSVKSRIKALISVELPKRKGRHRRSSTCPALSPHIPNDSFHHKDSSAEDLLGCENLEDRSPRTASDNNSSPASPIDPSSPKPFQEEQREVFNAVFAGNYLEHDHIEENGKRVSDTEIDQGGLDDNRNNASESASTHQQKEVLDAFNLINVNKEVFMKIMLQNSNSPFASHFHNQQSCNKHKKQYSKSMSFPSSHRRGSRSNKQKLKEDEVESHRKEGKSHIGGEAQVLIQPMSRRFLYSMSMPRISAEHIADGILKTDQPLSEGSGPVQQLNYSGHNQVGSKGFKSLKQRIRQVIKESKKEKNRITMDGILHKVPYSNMFSKGLKREMAHRLKNNPMSKFGEGSGRSHGNEYCVPSTSEHRCMRRASSLNESIDRYNRLYESCFNRDANVHDSETSSLTSDDKLSSPPRIKKTMGRLFSLPDMGSYSYTLENSSDAFSSSLDRSVVDGTMSLNSDFSEERSLKYPPGSENIEQLEMTVLTKNESLDNADDEKYIATGSQLLTPPYSETESNVVLGLITDDLIKLVTKDCIEVKKSDIQEPGLPITGHRGPSNVPMPESKILEGTSSARSSSFPEEDSCILTSKPGSLEEQSSNSCLDTPVEFEIGIDETGFQHKFLDNDDFPQFEVEAKDKAEFDYVKRILEISGFSGTDQFLGEWHSDDQPLDPSMYEDLEGSCMILDPSCSEDGQCHHLILFDLINEILLDIYSKSCCYYPKPLSSLSHIRAMPVGYRIVEEVWRNISWYLGSSPEEVHFLDYAVGKDFVKSDGWMNLQFDSECVGLELEDLIFDDLLDEAIDSL